MRSTLSFGADRPDLLTGARLICFQRGDHILVALDLFRNPVRIIDEVPAMHGPV